MEKYPSFSHLAESSVNSQTIHCTTTLQYLVSTSMMFGILTSTYNATHLHITTCNLDKKAEVMLTSVTLKKVKVIGMVQQACTLQDTITCQMRRLYALFDEISQQKGNFQC